MIFIRKPLKTFYCIITLSVVIYIFLNERNTQHCCQLEREAKNTNILWKIQGPNVIVKHYEYRVNNKSLSHGITSDVMVNTNGTFDDKNDAGVDENDVEDDKNNSDVDENDVEDDKNNADVDKKHVVVRNSIGSAREKKHSEKNANNISSEHTGVDYNYLQTLMNKYRDLYQHKVVHSVKDRFMFYITAVVSYNDIVGTLVTLNGWKENKGDNDGEEDVYCCLRAQGYTKVFKVSKINILDLSKIKVLAATQFMCIVNSTISESPGLKVALAMSKSSCKAASYIKAEREELPKSNAPSMAICGKILYGDFPAERVLEWLELNRINGVDKIVLFTSNVTKDTQRVLQYYVKEGFLIVKDFDFPLKYKYPRYLGQKYSLSYMDEQVVVYDCVSRFRKFTYFSVLDVDEFLMSRIHVNHGYKFLMKKLQKDYPLAGGFKFQTCLFVTDWNKTVDVSDIIVDQYTIRTQPIWDRSKNVIILDNAVLSSIWTHGFTPKLKNYRRQITRNVAVINHYRECRKEWKKNGICLPNLPTYRDTAMKMVIAMHGDKIRHVRNITIPSRR